MRKQSKHTPAARPPSTTRRMFRGSYVPPKAKLPPPPKPDSNKSTA